MAAPLPNAVTVEALYLQAILEELQALRASLADFPPCPPQDVPAGMVELREPRKRLLKKGRTK